MAELTRRDLLRASAATAGAAWLPAGVFADEAPGVFRGDPVGVLGDDPPPGFPAGVDVHREVYENWAGEIRVASLWTCVPRTAAEVVAAVNWAHAAGWKVRPRGYRHGWAPLTVTGATDPAAPVLLVDTTRHLTAMSIEPGPVPGSSAVRVGAGASMDDLLAFLEANGLGVTNTPAPGDLSVGGVLAINGHGTSVAAAGETLPPGHTYGTLSNLVLSLTAVVWDPSTGRYVLNTFNRGDPLGSALLTHVGRAFVTEAVLRVGADHNLRCVSHVDVPAAELFGPPGAPGRTYARYVDEGGRVEAIWFTNTTKPWVKVWSVSPERPLTSRPAVAPYNYPFSDNVPEAVSDLAERLLAGEWELTPTFGRLQYTVAAAGLTATLSSDLWGPSKNLLLYVKPTTLRETANGYAVLTSRASIQRVVHEFAVYHERSVAAYQARGLYPVTGQVEVRVAGVDRAADCGVPGAAPPALSAARPRADHPEWDVVVWFDVLTFPTAPGAHAFYRDMERFFLDTYQGYAAVRAEWSKGWGYTTTAAWADLPFVTGTVPDSYRQGPDPTWDSAVDVLNMFDPHRVFTNPFLDVLLA
ncbi:cholesterol oxidase substrate-binding domain-containing protein [Phytohabitans sp. ZYX-F-186]|uniref:Cholesterol oxidase substrate-binding domain-containing protein n=1 Tax=Phytohabitans maris TaxID=3071409 RepID=A0ABU0ZNP1_9ACTN|nr:cholesterol oxidase substrate-binding domain-containing protein [Phytohabitans sp. ZYX-F-186]MDQ7908658.1 cholesterol oxidase substrate-binding domain-containing protein [Phytohabitans sp. ZYX-F-186]